MSVNNTNTNTVINTITVGEAPFGVAVSPNGTRVYVTNAGNGTVSVIATNTVVATVTVGGVPQYLVVNPDGATVYVTNLNGTVCR